MCTIVVIRLWFAATNLLPVFWQTDHCEIITASSTTVPRGARLITPSAFLIISWFLEVHLLGSEMT
jgi:hypothetical protein